MKLTRIKEISKEKGVMFKTLASQLDLTPEGLDYAISNETLKGKQIEMAAKFLQVNVLEFFDEEVNSAQVSAIKIPSNVARSAEIGEVRRIAETIMNEVRELRKEIHLKLKLE